MNVNLSLEELRLILRWRLYFDFDVEESDRLAERLEDVLATSSAVEGSMRAAVREGLL